MYHSGRSGRGDNCIIIIEMVSTSPSSHRTLTRYTDPTTLSSRIKWPTNTKISKGNGYLQNIYTIRTLSVTVISSECSPVQRILITKQAISTSPHPTPDILMHTIMTLNHCCFCIYHFLFTFTALKHQSMVSSLLKTIRGIYTSHFHLQMFYPPAASSQERR